MKLHPWSEIPKEQMNPQTIRQVIHTGRITIARLELLKGAFVSRHSHENEQVTMLESGKLRFIFDDREQIVSAGEALEIPSHAPHAVEALEHSVAVDVFAPVREDWIRGDDAYLRR
jgi:quercetin dioxygenase-like cupin family protein